MLKGLLRKRLQSYILTSSASAQVMNAVLFFDAVSCKVQIANKIGLKFQQNQLKVDTNIVLYQNLVKDTILQI